MFCEASLIVVFRKWLKETRGNLMPHADHNGAHIHYKVKGKGPPLVLQHGTTISISVETRSFPSLFLNRFGFFSFNYM
jgi:hypothetical protein